MMLGGIFSKGLEFFEFRSNTEGFIVITLFQILFVSFLFYIKTKRKKINTLLNQFIFSNVLIFPIVYLFLKMISTAPTHMLIDEKISYSSELLFVLQWALFLTIFLSMIYTIFTLLVGLLESQINEKFRHTEIKNNKKLLVYTTFFIAINLLVLTLMIVSTGFIMIVLGI